MKLRYRMVISFMIIIIVPLLLYGGLLFDIIPLGGGVNIPEGASPAIVRERITDIFVSGIMIMMALAALLIMWTYHGIVRKVSMLVAGAEKIREGELDFSMEIKGNDEISELGYSFEQMRIRLKEDAVARLEAERNQRQLVSNIAHDLKTPLTAIRGYSEGIIDGVAKTPEKQLSYVTTILNKANEMDALLDELTAYSNLETNRIPYSFSRLNVREYFSELARELKLDLDNQNARFVYYNYVEEDAFFVADKIRIGRVFRNCVDNSIKYAGKDDLAIALGVWSEGGIIHIEIKDNGIGIDPKDLPHVFERLYRGDASRTSAGGSGIGLSIVKKIIEDHDGTVKVLSPPGEGTTVSFTMKKLVPQEEKSEQDTDRRRRRSNRRVGKGLSGAV